MQENTCHTSKSVPNITESELLANNPQIFQAIWAVMDCGIYILDVVDAGTDFRFVGFNPAFTRMSPVAIETLLGKTHAEIFPDKIAKIYCQRYAECFKSGQNIRFQEQFCVDGKITFLTVTVAPLMDKTPIQQLVATVTYISEPNISKTFSLNPQSLFQFLLDNSPPITDIKNNIQVIYPQSPIAQADAIHTYLNSNLNSNLNLQSSLQSDLSSHLRFSLSKTIAQNSDVISSEDIKEHQILEKLRAEAEKALQATEERLQTVISSAPLILYALNCQGIFTFSDGKALEVLGLKPGQVVGLSVYELYQDSPDLLDSIQQVLSGQELTCTTESMGVTFEQHLVPQRDESGKIIGLIGVALDISKRKAAEIKLQEQEEFLRTVFEGAENPIFVVDIHDNGEVYYSAWNSSTERVTGLKRTEVIGKTLKQVHGESESLALYKRVAECLQTGKPILDEECLTFNNQPLWSAITVSPVQNNDGKIHRIVVTTLNITQRKLIEIQLQKQTEELQQTLTELQHAQAQLVQSEKMSSLGQLVAGVAHEINNPVSFIYSNLEPAAEYIKNLFNLLQLYQEYYPEPVTAVQDEIEAIDLEFIAQDLPKLLSSMKMGANRIKQIVLSLRTFSRMDEAEYKTVNIHQGIDSTLVILEHRLRETSYRQQINVIKQYGKLPEVECYAGQLNQVFMNILSNAIDALEEKITNPNIVSEEENFIPTIWIQTQLINPENINSEKINAEHKNLQNPSNIALIMIRIADNGFGIPQAVQKRLFDPFYTTKAVGKGTGMGLSISYQIITEKHGGQLKCISSPGKGAEFIITIPHKQSKVTHA
ncbi:two-component sensor histidine kinase [Calothrix sp. NIES-4101]|nr:two-component sensor histidine kinase [Calothrix sp. NIES-4101]